MGKINDRLSKKPNLYYLQNADMGYLGNAPYWWHMTNCGYTVNIAEAKKWTYKEAISQVRSCRGSHRFVPWKVSELDKATQRVVDLQLMGVNRWDKE